MHLAHSKEQGHAPIPAGDHEGRPYGSSGILPVCMAWVDAYSHPREPTLAFLCLFIGTKNGVDGRSADGALTFECWFTILHGDFLRVLHLSLCFAFDTVILIGHGEVASLHCSKTLKNTYNPIFGMYGTRQVHFISLFLQ